MASRLKEEEKNERIIRGLLKLPGNRRCINCNSLGPQYVCINFWTFICTTCSGIHREFTHRVKSISMAKFTSQEVAALQGGGNEKARQIYFKEWDLQRLPSPDSSNIGKLRDFIKHVYVDKRYTGDRNLQKSSSGNTVVKEDLYGGVSNSPAHGDAHARRYSEGGHPGGRSGDRFGDSYSDNRSSSYSEVINDWRRNDRFANGRSGEEHRLSDGNYKVGSRSPDSQNDASTSSSPVVRPVRDILGENVPLRIIRPPRPGSGEVTNNILQNQSNVAAISQEPKKDNVEPKAESLIDFDDPGPVPSSAPQPQRNAAAQPAPGTTNFSSGNNWASFDFPSTPSSTNVPSSSKSVESVFSDLSVPTQQPVAPSSIGLGSDVAATFHSWTDPPSSVVPSISQPISLSLVSSGPLDNPTLPATVSSQTRRELPEDVFAMRPMTYHGFAPQNPGWQMGGPGVRDPFMVGLSPRFPQPSGTFNPFDFNGPAVAPSGFPFLTSLQTALPNLATQTSPFNAPPSAWMHPALGPQHSPAPYTFPVPPRPYAGQQLPGGSVYPDGQMMPYMSQSAPNSSSSASRNPFA